MRQSKNRQTHVHHETRPMANRAMTYEGIVVSGNALDAAAGESGARRSSGNGADRELRAPGPCGRGPEGDADRARRSRREGPGAGPGGWGRDGEVAGVGPGQRLG